MRPLLAPAAAAAALAMVTLPASAAPGGPRSGSGDAPAVTWGPCPQDLDGPGVTCGTLEVPLNHDRPAAGSTRIAFAKVAAAGGVPRRGTIFVNPGGPGGGGMWLAPLVGDRLPAEITRAYDIVGIDPRGNGHSNPITCADPEPAPRRDPRPREDADVHAHLRQAEDYAGACLERSGELVAHLSTVANARDLDAVRAALAEPRISYLGWSYGTYLGAVYGQLYPDRVDRMILGSVVDPTRVWYGVNLAQNGAFQARWRDFTRWAAEHQGELRLGSSAAEVDAAWQRVLREVRARPAGGVAGSAEVLDMATSAMYSSAAWPGFARALRGHLDGDSSLLADRHRPPDTGDANSTAVYTAVECNDAPWPREARTWFRDADRSDRTAPLLTWSNTWLNAPCMTWPVEPVEQRRPVHIDGRGLPPVLLVQGTNDAATPLAGARAMHRALPGSRLITVTGEGDHGVLVFSPNGCVEAHAVAYLRDGTLPAGDQACPAVPEPVPVAEPGPAATATAEGARGLLVPGRAGR